jgi:hypothetical protein
MEKIDFVITWVDGSDPKWLAEKNKYENVRSTLSRVTAPQALQPNE